jgi:threonine/homoserine/homoserine lactone efflux protein
MSATSAKLGNIFGAIRPSVEPVHPDHLLAFWGLAFVLIVVPGPDWAFVLASGARDHIVLPAVSGLMTGYALLTVIVAAGIGSLVAHTPSLLTGLTAIGSAYLIYLGASLLFRPTALAVEQRTGRSHLLRGIAVSGLNPKGLLIFLAVLPQFADAHDRWPLAIQLGALGAVFVLTCGVFYAVVGFAARALLTTRPRTARMLSRLSGAAMLLVGLALVVERLKT